LLHQLVVEVGPLFERVGTGVGLDRASSWARSTHLRRRRAIDEARSRRITKPVTSSSFTIRHLAATRCTVLTWGAGPPVMASPRSPRLVILVMKRARGTPRCSTGCIMVSGESPLRFRGSATITARSTAGVRRRLRRPVPPDPGQSIHRVAVRLIEAVQGEFEPQLPFSLLPRGFFSRPPCRPRRTPRVDLLLRKPQHGLPSSSARRWSHHARARHRACFLVLRRPPIAFS